jgi:signal transduction histidine kinase
VRYLPPRTSSIRSEFGRLSHQWALLLAFLVILSVFIASYAAVLHRTRAIQQQAESIEADALQSVELVSEIGLDQTRKRRLISDHILETEPAEMSRIEKEMAKTDADFERAAAQYGPIATFPGEEAMWLRLQSDIALVRGPAERTLTLSRQNRDLEARESFHALDEKFTDVSEDVTALIRINRDNAQQQLNEMTALQRSLSSFQMFAILIGILTTLAVAWWTIRTIGQREQQLTRYASILEKRNRELDAFAGRVAHDLRNPLSTIHLGVAQLSDQPQIQDRIAIVRRGISRMNTLIEDLLALSRITAEQPKVCDPADAAAEVLDDLSPRVDEEGGTIQVNVATANVRCAGGLLRQALWNLADNAVKYRRPDEPAYVEITGRTNRGEYELRVSDKGVGMSPEETEKAFDPFYRAQQAHKLPGTGLGLSIVKRVVEASGGTISVDSKRGHGTTFTIHLPLAS